MATGVVGTASMLRARRRDVNVKPNRRLDRKSSRGMLYENEELRLRTININAEVERGQNDIKKLRRENEQLRREIWGLRDEYDRLEGLLGRLRASGRGSVADFEELKDEKGWNVEDDENGRSVEENEQNLQKITSIKSQCHKNSMKVGFDDLSVVDEETDDFVFGNSNEREKKTLSPEGHLVNIFPLVEQGSSYFPPGAGSPEYFTPFPSAKSVCPHSNFEGPGPTSTQRNNALEHSLCSLKEVCAGHMHPRACYSGKTVRYGAETGKENSTEQISLKHELERGCTCTDSFHDMIPSQRDFSLHAPYHNNSLYKAFPQSKEHMLPESFQGHEGADIFTTDAYPAERCRSQFPMGGNLDQLLNDVQERKGEVSVSKITHTIKLNEPVKHPAPSGSAIPTTESTSVHDFEDKRKPENVVRRDANESNNDKLQENHPGILKNTTSETCSENVQKDGRKSPKESDTAAVTTQLADLTVQNDKSEEKEKVADRFCSNVHIQLEQPEEQSSSAPIATPAAPRQPPTRKVANVHHFIFQEHNPIFSEYLPSDADWRRRLDKHPLNHRYESFISSTPELSNGKFEIFSGSVKNVHSFETSGDLVRGDSHVIKQCHPFTEGPKASESSRNAPELSAFPQPDSNSEISVKGHEIAPRPELQYPPRNNLVTSEVDLQGNAREISTFENPSSALSNKQSKPHSVLTVDPDRSSFRSEFCISQNKMCDDSVREAKPKFLHNDELLCTVNLPPSQDGIFWQNSVKRDSELASTSQAGSGERKDAFFGATKMNSIHHCSESECHVQCRGNKSKHFPSAAKCKYSDFRPSHKLSVIVGDTQQGRSIPSPGPDSPTKGDRNRRVSVYSNTKRKFGIVGRKDSRMAKKQTTLTRSISLDPARCRLVSCDTDCTIAMNELGLRERANSVSSKTSSMGTGLNSINVNHCVSRNSNQTIHEKSVPWCGCWGNGCI